MLVNTPAIPQVTPPVRHIFNLFFPENLSRFLCSIGGIIAAVNIQPNGADPFFV